MSYLSIYVTVQFDHGKQLGRHGIPCCVADKICIIVSNILIRLIYAAHPIIVIIQNAWNLDINLTTLSPDFVHVALVLLVH